VRARVRAPHRAVVVRVGRILGPAVARPDGTAASPGVARPARRYSTASMRWRPAGVTPSPSRRFAPMPARPTAQANRRPRKRAPQRPTTRSSFTAGARSSRPWCRDSRC
jgi:hypothetical protein